MTIYNNFKLSLSLSLIITSAVPALADTKTVTIGLLTELTGDSASNGVLCKQGYELARNIYAAGEC